MSCYRIKYKHSARRPDYVGTALKFAHDKDAALDCMARKGSSYSKKTNLVVDSKGNVLTIIDIHETT
jgi:hypothetical protein